MSEHNIYCQEVPETRRGCYCWEGDRKNLAEMRLQNSEADRDRWRSIAERAMDLLEEANKVLATIQEGLKRD